MNIKITHSWLTDIIDTKASQKDIEKYLSLCGPSVESTTKIGSDYTYDIEITTNRIDTASVYGIATECYAILPEYGIQTRLKSQFLSQTYSHIKKQSHNLPLELSVKNEGLVSRIATIVLDNVNVAPSTKKISDRLSACGISSINNVVDVSNYLNLMYGQPLHIFDYDAIGNNSLTVLLSTKGDVIKTLDASTISLPGDDVIMKDGHGRIVDLLGIMGGQNSQVTNTTKRVVVFIPLLQKHKVRYTVMHTGKRTTASTYFEKGLDPMRIEPQLVEAVNMLSKLAGAVTASSVIEHYPHVTEPKIIYVNHDEIEGRIGVSIPPEVVKRILTHLGFCVDDKSDKYTITIPSFRLDDIHGCEDIAEEIARVYGYHKIPAKQYVGTLVQQPKDSASIYEVQDVSRAFLSSRGWDEVYNFSMISQELHTLFNLPIKQSVSVQNPISEDGVFMRSSLLPSLAQNANANRGECNIKIYEMARIYESEKNNLPNEHNTLGMLSSESMSSLKGILVDLFTTIGIKHVSYTRGESLTFIIPSSYANITIGDKNCGFVGTLKHSVASYFGPWNHLHCVHISVDTLAQIYNLFFSYTSPSQTTPISLDLTYNSHPKMLYSHIQTEAFKTSRFLRNIQLQDVFDNNVTLRFTFIKNSINITEEEAKGELEKIRKSLSL